jgi:type IV pilus assembly protein PilA
MITAPRRRPRRPRSPGGARPSDRPQQDRRRDEGAATRRTALLDVVRRGGEDGFTLVELLVVILIVGVLAGVAVPTFLDQRERAWDSATRSELRNAVVALESYRAENGVYDEAALAGGWGYVAGSDVVLDASGILDEEFCLSARYGTTGTEFAVSDGTTIDVGTC